MSPTRRPPPTTDITVTLDVLPRTVCLPLAPELTDAEADRVIEAVHGFHPMRA
ncbi:hypothetical protein [Streptomyces sp. NPDC002602]|uniref:hypothetical protein n=1 Tax=Streptomyces sp. NPDC002602 TaxID=3364654 RepID=UPI00369E5B4D